MGVENRRRGLTRGYGALAKQLSQHPCSNERGHFRNVCVHFYHVDPSHNQQIEPRERQQICTGGVAESDGIGYYLEG